MAMQIKGISNWSKIFIDTSIVINLFHAQKPEHTDTKALFIKKLIHYLGNSKDSINKDRLFYISSITISEILCREHDSEKVKKIMKAMNGKDTEFTSFDTQSALLFNYHLWEHLSNPKLNQYALEFGFLDGEFNMAREWITRDFMILVNAMQNNADVILTTDRKTMYKLAQKIDAPCVLCLEDLFDHSEDFILKYHHDKVTEDYLNPPKPVKPSKLKSEGNKLKAELKAPTQDKSTSGKGKVAPISTKESKEVRTSEPEPTKTAVALVDESQTKSVKFSAEKEAANISETDHHSESAETRI